MYQLHWCTTSQETQNIVSAVNGEWDATDGAYVQQPTSGEFLL